MHYLTNIKFADIANRYFLSLLIAIIYSTRLIALEPRDIVVLILSQENTHNSKIAHNLEQNIIQQSIDHQVPAVVYLSHRDFPHVGDWTILPILPLIAAAHKANAAWMLVCNDRTHIHLNRLIDVLNNYNDTQEIWIGHALHDRDVTIIHHFAFYEDPTNFLYPNIASGFAISLPLLTKIADRFTTQQYENSDTDLEFSIDASHELSLFVWDKDKGHSLIHEPNFCVDNDNKNCATFVTPFTSCGDPIPNNSIYFAVKTCSKFHKDRVRAVQKTWAKYAPNIHYFSDVKDNKIPTITLNIANTEHGHCAKTFAIIKHAYNELKSNNHIKWVVITDDDTIISPSRLCHLLTCYQNTNEFLALGERYGYQVQNLDQIGYNYITGGGGTVLSANLVEKIVENPDICSCPKIDSPDDMFLGVCLARLGVKVTHSPHFHQARPNDYAPEYLSKEEAISFHKHWMIKPEDVYQQWFEESDKKMFDSTNLSDKTEL